MMLEDDGHVVVAPTGKIWIDNFLEAVSTPIASHTPDSGGAYLSNLAMSLTTIVASTPLNIVEGGTGLLRRGTGTTGALFDFGAPTCDISFTTPTLQTYGNRYSWRNAPRAGSIGPMVIVSYLGVDLYRTGASAIDGSFSGSFSGSTFRITDDGGSAAGSIKVYVNGVLRITSSATGFTANGNTHHGIVSTSYNATFAALRVTELGS